MPQLNIQPILNYEDLGFSKYLEKPITTGIEPQMTAYQSQLNFDQVQTSGSLGDKIQVGNIIIDGQNGRIEIIENSEVQLVLGKDYD